MSKSDKAKKFMGMPMRWERKNIFKNIWNTEDDQIFPPKFFGIGWDLNLHAVLKWAGMLKNKKSNPDSGS